MMKELKTRTLHTRFKPSVWEMLEALAKEDRRTITDYLECHVRDETERRKKRRE